MNRFILLSAMLWLSAAPLPAASQEADASPVPPTVTFVVSTGFWHEEPEADGDPERRGYYKLIAVRQPDGTAQVHLQQIEATAEGPVVLSSAELEEFSAMKPYVTDIRPENSTGITTQPGLFATVHLKTDPQVAEPENWTVLIDDLGEIRIEKATN